MAGKEKVLLVEDDPHIGRIVCDHLRKEGFFVTWSTTGIEGWDDFKHEDYSLVLVDLMLPEMDGFSLCKKIRMESNVPILIVSAKNEDSSKINGLNIGADDYITKPFSLDELHARIHSHLRRYRRFINRHSQMHTFSGGLRVDEQTRTVYLYGKPVLLTVKEMELFLLMMKNPFKTFSKAELYEHVWQQEELNGNNTVTVHIKSIREKLNDHSKAAKFIQTVWGSGYRFIGEAIDEN
ncbi:DNA-binding response OmpR family regulator [Cytobacillus horneckiae]|uniref:DNA-binding response regulator n=1 Tax=Cytobacillus horneckiae TaxID=549687 RepID=A0A2N0Z9Y6_9BACI|nr:response regulator transcription factor [Cytobacillus horneckiae]MBN6886457.1 response regulator transcription factor [Cytobacillus horneckiae]MCM3176698.1 response regulator transcription factor [Cytobacillus horneckiae]MEC1158465.1 response regulator transcription factor [Cytobacillus horneckiae]MED2939568.1 response regulator transcription factor [Cytobacillus horneckiae]PKG26326.1 DNA-binding response regulator [Cytobacillus horneckiae]